MAQDTPKLAPRKRSKLQRKNTLIAYSFLAPNFLGFLIITMLPILFTVVLSLLNWNGGVLENMQWVGLDNFAEIFKRFSFQRSDLGITLKNTVFYTLATVPLTIVFSLVFALLLNKAVKAASVFRFIFFFPYVASIVAVCTCWNYLLMKYGVVNSFLNTIGFNMTKSWTQSKSLAMWALIIVAVWRYAGYYMVLYIAGLQNIPSELYEAATVDGANAWQKFRKITLPMLTPTTFFVSIMTTITCFKVFDTVILMTDSGPGRATKMLVNYIFDLSFNQIKYGVASAVAMVLFVVVLIVTVLQFRVEKKWVNYF